MPSVSFGLACSCVLQNLLTSGSQAARSRSLPWLIAAGGGCGGNCWAAAAVTAKTKAIDNIDIRIMVALSPHLRAFGPSPVGKFISYFARTVARSGHFYRVVRKRLPACVIVPQQHCGDALARWRNAGIHL